VNSPPIEAQLAAVRELAELGAGAPAERDLADGALTVFGRLLPGRAIALRLLDLRKSEGVRAYVTGGALRDSIATEGVTIAPTALAAARLKSAVAASARLLVRERWDSPFTGMATGFTVALASGGELYGVVDIGYPPSGDRRIDDEAAVQLLSNQLAGLLRTARLHDDALGLRDYQARLLESANALILGVDRGWRITVCNRALLELTGFSRDEVYGRDVRDFITADQRQYLTTAFASAMNGQHHTAVTIGLPTKSAGLVRTVWSIAPVGRAGAPGGPIDAVVAIGQDQSKIEQLQHQVVRAERLATLGELAAGVVHELNNPLTSITVYAEYLVRKLESQGNEATDIEKLRRIGASAQRILRFTRDLVQYARPSAKEASPVDLGGVVQQSISICEHLVERSGIELSVSIDPELPAIHAVSGQLEQVFINLITNAVHAVEALALDSGGSSLGRSVRVSARVDNQSTVLIEVADSGTGVPEADREKIFEPFFTTKADGKGTGLGLPIVRNIVENHRGEISVSRSDLGGAAFRVVIPIY